MEKTEVVNSTKTNEKNSQQVKKNESSFAVKVSSLKIKFLSADSFEGYVSSWENLLWVLEMILFFQMLSSKSLENYCHKKNNGKILQNIAHFCDCFYFKIELIVDANFVLKTVGNFEF